MLIFLDYFFTIFHTAFVLFVLFGWVPKSLRKFHISAIMLTLIAWLLIGFYKGVIGYCPLTSWHWDIKRQIGEVGMSGSFVGYMIEHYLGLKFSRLTYDVVTAGGLIFGVLMALGKEFQRRVKNKAD